MSYLSVKAESILFPMLYDNTDLQVLVDTASELLNAPVRFSPDNRIELAICSKNYPEGEMIRIKKMLSKDSHGFNTFMGVLSKRKENLIPFYSPATEDDYARVFSNVYIGERYFGNITIPGTNQELENMDMELVQTIARIIAISCSIDGVWGYNLNEQNLFKMILCGKIKTLMELSVMVSDSEKYHGKQYRLLAAKGRKSEENALITSALLRIFPDSLTAEEQGIIYTLVDLTEKEIRTYQIENLKESAKVLQADILIGCRFCNILNSNIQRSYLCSHPIFKKQPRGTLFYFDDHREYALFLRSNLETDGYLDYCNPALIEMIRWDQQQNSEYYKTLKQYIKNNFEIGKTAEALATHKNTILYRLKKIEEKWNLSCRDANHLFSIQLTMRLLKYFEQDD